jgi:hypothetical protein
MPFLTFWEHFITKERLDFLDQQNIQTFFTHFLEKSHLNKFFGTQKPDCRKIIFQNSPRYNFTPRNA